MTDSQIAGMFAAQTTIIHLLAEKLIKADVISRDDLVKDLYDLLDKQAALYAGTGPSRRSAPFRHFIRLVEGIE